MTGDEDGWIVCRIRTWPRPKKALLAYDKFAYLMEDNTVVELEEWWSPALNVHSDSHVPAFYTHPASKDGLLSLLLTSPWSFHNFLVKMACVPCALSQWHLHNRLRKLKKRRNTKGYTIPESLLYPTLMLLKQYVPNSWFGKTKVRLWLVFVPLLFSH